MKPSVLLIFELSEILSVVPSVVSCVVNCEISIAQLDIVQSSPASVLSNVILSDEPSLECPS